MPSRNLVSLLIVVAVSYLCYVRCDQNPFARHVATTYSLVDEWSWINVPRQELFAGAVEGMVDVLRKQGDEHSLFVGPADAQEYEAELRQQFGGIGVRIGMQGEPPQPTVVGPPEPNTPAYRSEIRAGDVIIAIDGELTVNMDMLAILRHMRGEPGTPLELTLRHEDADKEITVRLIRAMIPIRSILGDRRLGDGSWQFRLDEDPRIAYVRVTQFGDKTVAELLEVLAQLSEEGTEAVVLDLRDNAGGALEAAVLVSEMFLREGRLIVETRGRERQVRERFVAQSDGMYEHVPLAILINRNTASASEIVAACFQDHNRATIIGERSFGKGTVQRWLRVGARGSSRLKLTSATYWRPSGVNIHRMPHDTPDSAWGVSPNQGFEVALTDKQDAEFRQLRSQRDLIQTPKQQSTIGPDPSNDQAPFHDQALSLAVEHLQKDLGAGH
jgi:carboxyl-terminal processing protease